MNPFVLPPPPKPLAPHGLRALVAVGLITWCADFLLWPAAPRLALGIFAVTLGLIQFAVRGWRKWSLSAWLALGALLLSGLQSGIEVGFSNVFLLGLSLVWLTAEALYADLPWWGGLVETCFSFIRSPGRWLSLGTVAQSASSHTNKLFHRGASGWRVLGPAAFLGVLFASVLGGGNAILGAWMAHAFHVVTDFILSLDLSIGRIAFWILIATLALAFTAPAAGVLLKKFWPGQIPRWERRDPALGFWQSAAILVVLNGLFFAANTIDAFFLWMHTKLPVGVTYSEYVHQGAFDLIAAVLLSALVLSGIFLQHEEVTNVRSLKILADLWIVQNLILIGGVFRRLEMYVVAYELTPLRIYLGCFLFLVIAGFVLLTIYVERGKSLGWLMRTNLLAVFVFFFALQFTDAPGWTARYNTWHWRQNPAQSLDLNYLTQLGPSAWPFLLELADNAPTAMKLEIRERIRTLAAQHESEITDENWRSYEKRPDDAKRTVVTAATRWPDLPLWGSAQ